MFVQSLLTNGARLIDESVARWVAKSFESASVSLAPWIILKVVWCRQVPDFDARIKNVQKYCAKSNSSLNITTTVNEISVAELDKIAFWVNKIILLIGE